MNVGFIGLGLMGRPMALHLERAGHTLHLWARRPESLAPFAAVNAKTHATPAQVAAHAEVVIVMVADAPDVETRSPEPCATMPVSSTRGMTGCTPWATQPKAPSLQPPPKWDTGNPRLTWPSLVWQNFPLIPTANA